MSTRKSSSPLVAALETAKEQAADLGDRLAPVVEEARERGRQWGTAAATAAATRLDERLPDRATPASVRRRSRSGGSGTLRKLLMALGIGAGVALVVRKVSGGDKEPTWHTAVPPAADDAAGGSPDEAVADSVETAHAPTTPDAPAERIDVKE